MSLRAFIDLATSTEASVVPLSSDESHYIVRVRRARVGTELEVLDGRGAIYAAEVIEANPRACHVRLLGPIEVPSPPPLELALALTDPRATLVAIEHACEMGATKIVMLSCARSHGHPPSAARIDRVMRAAQRQCGRPTLPEIEGPLPLQAWLARPSALMGFVASVLHRERPSAEFVNGTSGARLLVGPEGGFTDEEHAAAEAAGLHPIGLSPWILRTETAVVAGLARVGATGGR